MVVLDTCALLEICKEKPSFSKNVYQVMEKTCYILSISFAEIACKVKLGKLEIEVTPRELYKDFSSLASVTIINIGVDEWLDSIELNWPDNKDPADRIITAFAHKNKLPVITTDQKIKKFYKNVIW